MESRNLLKRARTDYLKSEPVSIAKPFLWIAPLIFGANETAIFLSLYQYARIIDDTVDSASDPYHAKELLKNDLEALSGIMRGNSLNTLIPATEISRETLYRRSLLHTSLSRINPEGQPEIAKYLHQALQGAYVDNTAIMYGHPIHDYFKPERDNAAVLVYFEALSRVFFNKPFVEAEHEGKIKEFFQWVLRFDGLDDIVSDLERGICVFTRKSLKESGVNLVQGEPVGSEIADFYIKQRDKLVMESKTVLPYIYKSNLPILGSAALHVRLVQQAHRISKTEYPKGKAVVFGKARADW
ncbi:hypothetical protein HZC27_00695 [Candidatus Roizmanbacteria bacterium]|nr:hypothetical protein [Candidatus Roizmanbacteria bacterium]